MGLFKKKENLEYSNEKYTGYNVFYISSNYYDIYDIFNTFFKKDINENIVRYISNLTMCISNIKNNLNYFLFKYITNISNLKIHYKEDNDSLYLIGSIYDWTSYLQKLTQMGYDEELPNIIQKLCNESGKYLDRITKFKFNEPTILKYLSNIGISYNINISPIDRFVFVIQTEDNELVDKLISLSDTYYHIIDNMYIYSFNIIVFYEIYSNIIGYYISKDDIEYIEILFSNIKESIDDDSEFKLYNKDNNKNNDSYYKNIDEVIN